MAKKTLFEIYEGLGSRKKTFAVIPFKYKEEQLDAAVNHLKKVNHCSSQHLYLTTGYVWKDGLYFENPAIPGAKLVSVLLYVRQADY